MNCHNCGGAMELFAVARLFLLPILRILSFSRDEGRRRHPAGRRDPDASNCAVCDKPLASAMLDETHPMRYCRNCRGVLIARDEALPAVVENRRAWATGTPDPPVPLNPDDLSRKVRCPVCKGAMVTHPYLRPGQRRPRQLRIRASSSGSTSASSGRSSTRRATWTGSTTFGRWPRPVIGTEGRVGNLLTITGAL